MAARHRTVDRVRHMVDADRGVWQIDEEHARTFFGLRHDDADARTLCAGVEGLAAVDDPMISVGAACRLDRKSVVEGKSVSVRVDLGGRRIIKKKKYYEESS